VAASPRPPSWAIEHTEFNAGVLGETALPRFWSGKVRVCECENVERLEVGMEEGGGRADSFFCCLSMGSKNFLSWKN